MIQALLFDVFGTVVDWRSGISKDFELISKKYGLKKNSKQFSIVIAVSEALCKGDE